MRKLFGLLLVLLATTMLRAQNYTQGYTQIVVFGDSLSDTGNFARTVQNGYGVRAPGPLFGYTDGRFTDGTDTSPAARLYAGVWLEQMAATLTPPVTVKDSMDGGTNYAFGDATNANSSQTVAVAAGVNITVPNVGVQISSYLATKPAITAKTLFVVWGGGNDLTQAASPGAAAPIAAQQAIANVQALVAAGATQIIVPNQPPVGAIPAENMTPNAATYTAAAVTYNIALAAGLAQIVTANPNVTIYPMDIFSLFNAILPSPAVTGFANVTTTSQGVTTINPDTYLFWDTLHPTTYGHSLIARYARNLLTQTLISGTTLSLSASTATAGQSVTLTAQAAVQKVTGSTAVPSGLLTFYNGSTPLVTVLADASGSATTTISAALAASPYTLTARYSGDATYTGSLSNSVTLTVAAPGYTLSASPSTVTVTHGATASSVLTLTPTGNLSGTYTPACGALPAYVTCSFSNATLTAANNTAVSTTVSFGTAVTAANSVPAQPGSMPSMPLFTAFALLGSLGLAAKGRKRLHPALLGLLALLTLTAMGTLNGCSGSGTSNTTSGPTTHTAAPGTYTIPITFTPAVSGSNNTLNVTLIVQ